MHSGLGRMGSQEHHSGAPSADARDRRAWSGWLGLSGPGRSMPLGRQLLVLLMAVVLVPVVLITVNAEIASNRLKDAIRSSIDEAANGLLTAAPDMRDAAVARASEALDERVRQEIERMTTDLARSVARFLYERDQDILYAAELPPDPEAYGAFLAHRLGPVADPLNWRLRADGRGWEPVEAPPMDIEAPRAAGNADSHGRHLWKARPPEVVGLGTPKPLYLEMTFVDLSGMERVKVTTAPHMDGERRDVSRRENTFARAETYFESLRALRPGDIHVTEMVGIYQPSRVVGAFTPAAAEAAGIPFLPREAAYAGSENPVGQRYRGLVRWATPVVRNGKVAGYVTLALDQRHLAAFTDRLDPTDRRYTDVPDPSEGNYAFMLDHKGRTITHPRHYYIVGHDPETGALVPPWMDEDTYRAWTASGLPIERFLATVPPFDGQSQDKRPSREQLKAGTIAADCRYLNFAPQCSGWHDLTAGGGSGSYQISWSGVSKLNTAAPIPYFTGPYAASERGFGYITIGVNMARFHAPADEISSLIDGIAGGFADRTRDIIGALSHDIRGVFDDAKLGLLALGVVLVGGSLSIAAVFSRSLTRRVGEVVSGIRAFQEGQRELRIPVRSDDELGRIAAAFNVMAEEIDGAVHSLMDSEQRFRATFQQSVLLLGLLSRDGVLIKANPAALRVIGAQDADVIGKPFWDTPWWAGEPGQAERLKLAVANAAAGRVDRFTGIHKVRGRPIVVVDLTVAAISLSSGVEILVIGHDISDRFAMEHQREELIDRLGRSNAELSRFAEVTAHHLQEPVRRLSSFATRLERTLGDAVDDWPDAKISLDFITENASHLRTLLQDVQIYLAADQPRGDIAPINAAWAVEEARTRLADVIAQTTPDIIVLPLPDVLIDRPRLRDVMVVLLENALKFRREGTPPKIIIQGESDGDTVTLRMTDNGIGIEPQFRARVLQVFERLHKVSDYRGTGIGLAIVRRIAESLDGGVSIGDGIGGGTSVTVVFRRQAPAPEAEADGRSPQPASLPRQPA
ncbi:sensor histidine kinase [Novispirillum sp. DQ9]|uniref:sensor histidine kinase n=1 Tax=Novispirillum sp. DQ9 TaxID=3398612 RepID=UPI003C7A9578